MDIVDSAKFNVSEKELFFPPFKLFSRWGKSSGENDAETFEVKITISKNNNKKIKEVVIDKFPVNIPDKSSFATVILEFDRIKVKEEGLWFIHISFKEEAKGKWKEASRLPLSLKMQQPID
jgi:hypothetical protein